VQYYSEKFYNPKVLFAMLGARRLPHGQEKGSQTSP
jgi:hypothetical protein